MKILGLESSGMVASIAVVEDDKLVGEYTINHKKTHSQTLLPMLDQVVQMTDLDLNSLDAIAVSGGPGSFTGLRIGSATAKGLGLALNKPLVHVKTVDAMAFNLWGNPNLICPLMDARRNQVYTGLYEFSKGELIRVKEQCAVLINEIVEAINETGKEVVFLGDGVEVYKDYIEENVKVPYTFAPSTLNMQRASSVASLGGIMYKAGEYESAEAHKPDYLRVSQAERERQEKERDFRI